MRKSSLLWMFLAVLGLAAFGCGDTADEAEEATLSDLDILMDGAPDKADMIDEKTDQIVPKRFVELTELQSSVKSQGRRGVCSIFSTAALMEHLYIKEGTFTDMDFSEQYLQWSVKFEVGSFPRSGGSNASSNLQAISRYGIVAEADWPYEASGWNSNNDPECTGDDDQPTKCYTNGAPPDSAMSAQKWKLPRSRWVSSRPDSIKAFMINKRQGVIVGGTFFYQSWNHGSSSLPTSSEYKRKGYVLSPNATDRTKSLEKRAGHSFLLVGWDDDLEVQKRDAEGEKIVDADGNAVMEKGFFLFKNSWGTGSFGVENPEGDGYGWISYDYVDGDLSANASDVPEVEVPDEICGDELDNDRDGDVDCDDSDCVEAPQCQSGPQVFVNDTSEYIPDNDPEGATSTIEVPVDAEISALSISVDITHDYTGDLEIRLQGPDGTEVQVVEPWVEAFVNLQRTYVVNGFSGKRSVGTWTLKVIDHGAPDVGTLNTWSLQINSDTQIDPEICDDLIDNDLDGETDCQDPDCIDLPICEQNGPSVFENNTATAIPDDDIAGVTSTIQVGEGGSISSLRLTVDISHSYSGDLQIELSGPDGIFVLVQEASGSSAPDIKKSFDLPDFVGMDSAGTWTLKVADHAAQDTGTINSWSLMIAS